MKTRNLLILLAAAAALAGVLLHLFAGVRTDDLLAFGVGAALLLWQVLLLTVPWALFFQARQVVQEVGTSRERGLEVPAGQAEEAARIARRLRLVAIGAHLLSAAVVAVVTYFSGRSVGYYFSGFYLVSTLLRPAQAYLAHIRGRLRTMLGEARFPRDDVETLKARVAAGEAERKQLRELLDQLGHRCDELAAGIGKMDSRLADRGDQIEARATARTDQLETRFAARHDRVAQQVQSLARRFDDALDSYTDNQELVTGLKAFLRMLRADPG